MTAAARYCSSYCAVAPSIDGGTYTVEGSRDSTTCGHQLLSNHFLPMCSVLKIYIYPLLLLEMGPAEGRLIVSNPLRVHHNSLARTHTIFGVAHLVLLSD